MTLIASSPWFFGFSTVPSTMVSGTWHVPGLFNMYFFPLYSSATPAQLYAANPFPSSDLRSLLFHRARILFPILRSFQTVLKCTDGRLVHVAFSNSYRSNAAIVHRSMTAEYRYRRRRRPNKDKRPFQGSSRGYYLSLVEYKSFNNTIQRQLGWYRVLPIAEQNLYRPILPIINHLFSSTAATTPCRSFMRKNSIKLTTWGIPIRHYPIESPYKIPYYTISLWNSAAATT